MFKFIICISILLLFSSCHSVVIEQHDTIIWGNELTLKTFEIAKEENKIILLNLEANWCHWCHVMHDSTYSNPEVIRFVNDYYIPIKVDQDATPELANRYRKYGWPATIFINSNGEDLVKKAGYINKNKFLSLLQQIEENPNVEKGGTKLADLKVTDSLEKKVIQRLRQNLEKALDYKLGGFNQPQKYVDYEAFEYALFKSENPNDKEWARISTEGAKSLSDPVWGGVYQYSTFKDWNHLHYEKLLSIQARYLKIFTQSYLYFNDTSSLTFAENILSYSNRFLKSSHGLYGNSQDADLIQGEHSESYFNLSNEERMKLGVPRVDTNTYTINNAEMIPSLLMLYHSTRKSEYKINYKKILVQLLKRKNEDGLYSHSFKKDKVINLKDNLSMASALISLTRNTGNKYDDELKSLMKAIKSNFILNNGSFKSFSGNIGLKESPIISENIIAARLFNWYGHYSKDEFYMKIAKKTYQFLITPEVATTYFLEPGILSLQKEINTEPNHFVSLIKGANVDFINRAKAMAPFYSLFETYKAEDLPEDKKELFEGFEESVMLVCTSSYCSSPIYDEKDVNQFSLKE